ncbi:GNAT family N-acetyltransferase [Methanorbis furvi]|uniref:N-acetyltransferase domain-containing protein n=1 Tax=Methanorbis furvi TaxID=3028299 RepID=A0AAE4MBI2_9EURY|nr:hypothetical protein [Methanocorpusculaceae archaeon Ag1]
MNITIRPYESTDLYHVMTVWNSIIAEGDAFLEETALTPEDMQKFLDQYRVYCAKIGSEVAGVYLLRKLNLGKGAHIAEVLYAVKFSFRNLGVGKTMSEHSSKTARELGFSSLVCQRVSGMNPAALNFLTKCGFVPAGEISRGYRNVKTVKVDQNSAADESKKGLLGKIFEKKPAEPVEKTVVDYYSLYTYQKDV